MNSSSSSPESIAQMSVVTLANFKSLNALSQRYRMTISCIYVYIAIGGLNIHKLDDTRIMFMSVTPSRAAKELNFSLKKMSHFISTLAARGLLLRDEGGACKVADLTEWLRVAKLLNIDIPDLDFDRDGIDPSYVVQAANADFSEVRSISASMRDRS